MNIATISSRRLSIFVALLAFCFVASSANAQAFHVEPTSGSLEFNAQAGAQATQTLQLQNLTTSPLVVTATISGSGSSAFSMNSLPAITLLDTTRKAIAITYHPTTSASNTATLTLVGGGDTQTVALNGHTVTQSGDDAIRVTDEMHFSARVGESQCIPITISNISVGAVALTNFKISGGNNQFTLSGVDSSSLAAGGSRTITVCYTPVSGTAEAEASLSFGYRGLLDSLLSGTQKIDLEGTVIGAANAGDSLYFNVDRKIEFEDVPAGTQSCRTVRISNPTATAVTIDSASLSGTSAGSYSVSGATNLVVAANSTQYVTVCFTPVAGMEDQNATLNLYYTSGTMKGTLHVALEGSVESVDTTGTGTGSNRCIHVRRSIGVIGPIVQGGTASSTIYLTNATGGNVSISGATLTSGDSAAFSVSASQFPLNIAAGQQGQFTVTFNPTNANAMGQVRYTSRVQLTATGDSLNCGSITIQVGGVAVPGNHRDTTKHSIDLTSGGSVDLNNTIGITTTGTTTVDTLTFYNTTSAPITVNSVFMPTTANLSLIGSTVTTPTVIQPGGQIQAYVQFNSNGQTGTVFTNQLYVATDQSIQPQAFLLQAIQAAPAAVAAKTPASVDFSIVPNPSSGDIRVILPNNATSVSVEIFDLLGNRVAQLTSAQNFSWKGEDASGTVVPAGVYVVRVSGTDAEGHEVRGTRQVVIQK
jgi:hypothetical protein